MVLSTLPDTKAVFPEGVVADDKLLTGNEEKLGTLFVGSASDTAVDTFITGKRISGKLSNEGGVESVEGIDVLGALSVALLVCSSMIQNRVKK